MRFTRLSDTKTVWFTFWLTLAQTACFGVTMMVWEFKIIDEMYDAQQLAAHIDAMSPKQRQVHAWMTSTLDVLYPLTYASFFVGITTKAFPGKMGVWLATPSLLCVPADLLEGFAQVMLLNGYDDYLQVKTTATPLKLVLFTTALVIAIASTVRLAKKPRVKED